MKRPEPRLRLVFTLQLHVAVGAGTLKVRWQPITGGAHGRILWLGPFGAGVHVIAKDANADEGPKAGTDPSPGSPSAGPSPDVGVRS